MEVQKNKKIIILVFSAIVVLVLLMAFSYWDAFLDKDKESSGLIPFFYGIAIIMVAGYLFNIALKGNDPKFLEESISSAVEKTKARIYAEIKKDEQEEEVDDQNIEELINEKVEKILPSAQVKKIDTFAKNLLHGFASEFEIIQGVFYLRGKGKSDKFSFIEGYALTNEEPIPEFKLGEGLAGEAAKSMEIITIDEIPEDYFITESGLGKAKPKFILIAPIIHANKVMAIVELASFKKLSDQNFSALKKSVDKIAERLIKLI